jgi:hypothetical protein
MPQLLFIEFEEGVLHGQDSPVVALPPHVTVCGLAGTVVTYCPTGEVNARGRHIYRQEVPA